jgi:hypothetical protein
VEPPADTDVDLAWVRDTLSALEPYTALNV